MSYNEHLKGSLLLLYNAILDKVSTLDARTTTPEQLALVALNGISESLGGQVFYIPMGVDGERRERDLKICLDWESGFTVSDLALKHGVSQQHVYAVISTKSQKYADKQAARKKRNELICASRQAGSTIAQLAKEFGLTNGGIAHIVRNSPVNSTE